MLIICPSGNVMNCKQSIIVSFSHYWAIPKTHSVVLAIRAGKVPPRGTKSSTLSLSCWFELILVLLLEHCRVSQIVTMSRLRFSASLLKSPMLNQNCKSDLNLTSWTSLLRTKPRISRINAQVPVRRMGRYEPSYLDEINYEPRYEAVQLRIKGHDFPVLEKYMKFSTSSASRSAFCFNAQWTQE